MDILQKRTVILLVGLTVLVAVTLVTILLINNQNAATKNENSAAETSCVENDGTWIESASECEGISEMQCTDQGGTFNECASACRNNPEAEVCTLQCVLVCEF